MANMINSELPRAGASVWTPWGPQSISSANPRLETLRRRLKKLGKGASADQAAQSDGDSFDRPECSYEP